MERVNLASCRSFNPLSLLFTQMLIRTSKSSVFLRPVLKCLATTWFARRGDNSFPARLKRLGAKLSMTDSWTEAEHQRLALVCLALVSMRPFQALA